VDKLGTFETLNVQWVLELTWNLKTDDHCFLFKARGIVEILNWFFSQVCGGQVSYVSTFKPWSTGKHHQDSSTSFFLFKASGIVFELSKWSKIVFSGSTVFALDEPMLFASRWSLNNIFKFNKRMVFSLPLAQCCRPYSTELVKVSLKPTRPYSKELVMVSLKPTLVANC